MRKIFSLALSLLVFSLTYGQKRAVMFDFLMGVNKPLGSLGIENSYGGKLGGGIRYHFKQKASINILQVNYDYFRKHDFTNATEQKENGNRSDILTLLSGYSHPILTIPVRDGNIKLHLGGNIGVGFVGHTTVDRRAKFCVNPTVSFEPFRAVFVDFGYFNLWGGYKNTSYLNFNLRYSF